MRDTFYKSGLLSSHKKSMMQVMGEQGMLYESFKESLKEPDHTMSDLHLNAVIVSLNECLDEYIKEATEEANMNEAVMRNAKDNVAKKVVKFTLADKRMSEQLNEKFNRYIKLFRDSQKNAAYDSIVKNAVNLSRMLKNLLGSAIIGLLIPGGIPAKIVGTVLALLIKVAKDKRTDEKYKGTILNDLKFELRIVQEKIKDAESRGDIKAKYKLMRIENQLGRSIEKIMYGFK